MSQAAASSRSASSVKLLVTKRATGDTQTYSFANHTIIFGRQPDCDVILDDTGVSRHHAQIVVSRHLIEIEDLDSGNGTFLNQNRLRPKERSPLRTGDKIRIEGFEIDIEIDVSAIKSSAKIDVTDPDIIEIKMIKKVLGALDQDKQPSLIVVSEPFANKKAVFADGQERLVIGRESDCELQLDASVVSRRHAIISAKWGGYAITDQNSKNGTFVNGERITEKMLKDGDEIVIGTIKSYFKNPRELDIEALSKSIVAAKEETRALSHPIAKTDKAANEDPAADVVHVPTDHDIKKQEAATPPDSASKPEPDAKADSNTSTKDANPETNSAASEESAESSPVSEEPVPTNKAPRSPSALSKFFSRFTTIELVFFGAGALIFALTLIMLAALLGS